MRPLDDKTVRQTRVDCKIMSRLSDTLVTDLLLRLHRPRHIVELGAGAAGWAATHARLLDYQPQWTLVENFKWALTPGGYQFEGEGWPTNTASLYHVARVKSNDRMDPRVVDHNNASLIEPADYIRYDCELDLGSFIRAAQPDAIIQIDDFTWNCSVNRILMVLELARQGELVPLWFGEKESAWCRTVQHRDSMLDVVRDNADVLTAHGLQPRFWERGLMEHYAVQLGFDWTYFSTRERDLSYHKTLETL